MMYDRIIIGGGASGLYFAANCPAEKGLILEKTASPGQKLLLSGSGQCNLTHGGSIKDFIGHYGPGGTKIRSALYQANNLLLMKFYAEHGLPLTERWDGKVFPKSMEAEQVLKLLLLLVKEKGWELVTDCPVTSLTVQPDGIFFINENYKSRQVIIAAGGCSYPATGSDGSMLSVLEKMGLNIVSPRPSLVPVTVQQYPYRHLSGVSFQNASVQIDGHWEKGGLLLTHNSFSGPAVLNLSRYASPGKALTISYIPAAALEHRFSGDRRKISASLAETMGLPKRFTEVLVQRAGMDPAQKAASLSGKEIQALSQLLFSDTFSISGTSGFGSAMATAGGVSLEEVHLKTFESKKHPGLYIIGETLDIDGDTGGYNLQFAFSSGYCAAKCVCKK